MPSHTVKFFSSQHPGLASMSVAAGSLITVLDACLVNGFGTQTLTTLSVSSGIMTGTKTAHGYVTDQIIATSGANESQLNTEWRITSVTADTFSATATGISNVTGTGTITAKVAPAGWSKPFSGTNLAAYKSVASGATGCVLRVDDTGASTARVVGYETMSDINTGVGPFPTAAQVSGGGYWRKSGSTGLVWFLLATDKAFYFFNEVRSDALLNHSIKFFGDFSSERLADAYACALQADAVDTLDTAYIWSQIGTTGFTSVNYSHLYVPRSFTQLGSGIELVTNHCGGQASGVPASVVPYPSGASNGVVLLPISAREATSYTYRCLAWPGVYGTPQASPVTPLDVLRGVGSDGKDLLAVAPRFGGNGTGRLFIDLTGPW